MRYIKDLSGTLIPQITELPIANSTNISQGAVVSLSAGLVIAAVNNLETKIAGVLATNHSGANTELSKWNDALTTQVYTSPTAVFAYDAPTITATTNSTTNTVEATGIAAFSAANVFQGGYLELASKTTNSTITDAVGTRKRITAFDATNKLFTAAFSGAVVAGDTFKVYPPIGFKEGDFSSNSKTIIVTARTNSSPMQVAGYDFETQEVQVMPRLHIYGNDNA